MKVTYTDAAGKVTVVEAVNVDVEVAGVKGTATIKETVTTKVGVSTSGSFIIVRSQKAGQWLTPLAGSIDTTK